MEYNKDDMSMQFIQMLINEVNASTCKCKISVHTSTHVKLRTDLKEYAYANLFNKLCIWEGLHIHKVRKMAKIRNQDNQVPRLTQDPTWESDKITIRHHIEEPRGKLLFPADYHKAATNRRENTTITGYK